MNKKTDYKKESLKLHKDKKGKICTALKFPIRGKKDLALAYTPGVAEVSKEIQKKPKSFYNLTSAGETIAVISDGSAVLGLGNVGAKAAMAVMEGKSYLFKAFADLNSVPIVLDTQDSGEIIKTVKNIAPSFAGINLEDISAPRCFQIEETLKKELEVPVFHDDQHGTAIVVLAGLINSLKIVKKKKESVKVVISGVGAAGVAIGKLLRLYGFKDILFADSKGILNEERKDLNQIKKSLLVFSKPNSAKTLKEALVEADIFIGVSKGGIVKGEDIAKMNKDSIVFAMANPTPEIMPEIAKAYGAKIVATGRSDFPNQINNLLAFPGVFKGALRYKKREITDKMKIKAAEALAKAVKKPSSSKIIPSVFQKNLVEIVARAMK